MAAGKKTFILVHGAWGGGWMWKPTAEILRERGHEVIAPTLTGMGERSHLLREDINLTTHILDIVNCIKWRDLEGKGITLVGHSYGGMVISGVVEKVLEGTIDSIVYLDAALPEDGESAYTHNNVPTESLPPFYEVREGAGNDLQEPLRSWVRGKLTPQSTATCTEPVHLTGARDKIRVKTFVRATKSTRAPRVELTAASVRDDPAWRYEELPCEHSTQLHMPRETADVLERAALA
jgi:pimeloyl-ACP methyl ester carboxylesterase